MVRWKSRGYVRVEKEVIGWASYHPIKGVTESMGRLCDVLCKVMVGECRAEAFCVRMFRFVEVDVEVSEKDVFARACTAVVKKVVKVGEKEGVGEFVSRAGRRAIDAGKDEGLARECGNSFHEFKGGVGEGERLREGEVRGETVLVNYGNASPSGRTGRGGQSVATWSNAGNDGFITSWAKPCLSNHNNIKLVVSDKV